ncbi:MAG TPA: helix-turn-helix transcriptional regulator [Bacteroidales bacterium]|nr:helix-turn-helix transcriptional regulator [Bacteroidales bacterium]
MKDRIRLIMEKENLTPARFADSLDINRAVISHILNGRNNPSLDVVTKILEVMDYINPEWLISGTGNIYKNGVEKESRHQEPDLFPQEHEIYNQRTEKINQSQGIEFKHTSNQSQGSDNKPIEIEKRNDRKITQIIIYYNDNTFEKFTP